MSSLASLQQLFWQAVRTEPGPAEVDQAFVSRGAISGRARLGIYRTAYWVRQINGLRELFPSVVARLGDGPFARLASRYVAAHPSTSHALEAQGADFPAWLSQTDALTAQVAALDWARWSVFTAIDVPSLGAGAVLPEHLPEAQLEVGPHVEVVEAELAAAPNLPGPDDARYVAVWRVGFEVHQLRLGAPEAAALRAAKSGVAFARLCEVLAAGDDSLDMPVRIFSTFHAWLGRGWVTSLI